MTCSNRTSQYPLEADNGSDTPNSSSSSAVGIGYRPTRGRGYLTRQRCGSSRSGIGRVTSTSRRFRAVRSPISLLLVTLGLLVVLGLLGTLGLLVFAFVLLPSASSGSLNQQKMSEPSAGNKVYGLAYRIR